MLPVEAVRWFREVGPDQPAGLSALCETASILPISWDGLDLVIKRGACCNITWLSVFSFVFLRLLTFLL